MGKLNLKAANGNEEIILNYLKENASADLCERINKGNKTLTQCWNYILTEAKKLAQNRCACVADDVVFGWAIHFFEEDAIKGEEFVKVDSAAKVETKDKPEKEVEKKPAKAKKVAAVDECQLSFEDLFG